MYSLFVLCPPRTQALRQLQLALFWWFTNTLKMSFMGGAECSTAGNPLAQFAKVGQQDTSLQRDRLVGRGPGQQESMRTQMGGPQDGVCYVLPEWRYMD